jgi:hypothetical protein
LHLHLQILRVAGKKSNYVKKKLKYALCYERIASPRGGCRIGMKTASGKPAASERTNDSVRNPTKLKKIKQVARRETRIQDRRFNSSPTSSFF